MLCLHTFVFFVRSKTEEIREDHVHTIAWFSGNPNLHQAAPTTQKCVATFRHLSLFATDSSISFLHHEKLTTIPLIWVAFARKLSRSPPRSSLSGTTPSSHSISRPTSEFAMRSPSSLRSVYETRFDHPRSSMRKRGRNF